MNWLFALLLGFIPGLVWLLFFLREDEHAEPPKMIFAAFISGGVAAFISLLLETVSAGTLEKLVIVLPRIFEDNISVFVGFAVIEEVIKFILIFILIRKSVHFDEPVDAMIYMMTGALGFATVENVVITYQNGLVDATSLILVRFVGATLLHALASGIIGHYWARGIVFRMEVKFILAGVLMASVFHTIFNMLVTKFSDYLVYPLAFLLLIGFFVLYDFEELKKLAQGQNSMATESSEQKDIHILV
ncbi:MAG: PrsW family glutamic-type intramembrane protease [Candidatus Paceibacterota bacterium]